MATRSRSCVHVVARFLVHRVEVPAADFLLEIVARAVFAHKRDANLEQKLTFWLAEIEPRAGVFALCRMCIGMDRIILPQRSRAAGLLNRPAT